MTLKAAVSLCTAIASYSAGRYGDRGVPNAKSFLGSSPYPPLGGFGGRAVSVAELVHEGGPVSHHIPRVSPYSLFLRLTVVAK